VRHTGREDGTKSRSAEADISTQAKQPKVELSSPTAAPDLNIGEVSSAQRNWLIVGIHRFGDQTLRRRRDEVRCPEDG
jgi:hypothetical protein